MQTGLAGVKVMEYSLTQAISANQRLAFYLVILSGLGAPTSELSFSFLDRQFMHLPHNHASII